MNRPALRRLFRAGYTTSLHLWLHLRSIFPPQNPLHLYPESPQKLRPNVQLNAPAPRINSRIFFLVKAKGNNKTGLPTTSKWQIGLFLWQKPARREPERSAASAKRAETSHQRVPRGAAPGDSLVTFSSGRKSPGCRAERLHWWVQGLPAPHKPPPGAGTTVPEKTLGNGVHKFHVVPLPPGVL